MACDVHPLVLISVIVCAVAVFVSLDGYDHLAAYFGTHSGNAKFNTAGDATSGSKYGRIFTNADLAKYDGTQGSLGLCLAILGKVFDVSKGAQHYGPGGGYHFFAGKDASKAFVTGEFDETGLTNDVSELNPVQLLGLEDWMQFYEKEYTYAGKVEGRFYDKHGEPTMALLTAQENMREGHRMKAADADDKRLYPPCNTAWTQKDGATIWCTNKSGGMERDWVGVPRKYYAPGATRYRCACIKVTGPPAASPGEDSNDGDLYNPMFKVYKGCHEHAIQCKVIEDT